MEELTPVKKKAARLKELELDRKNFLKTCRELTEYLAPQKGLYLSEGEKPHRQTDRFSKIVDATASEDNDLLASGIQGGLSSQSRDWFRLEASDPNAMQLEHVQIWLHAVEQQMRGVLAGSNFYSKVHDFYNDEGCFGNAVLLFENDDEKIVRFALSTPGTYCFAEGVNRTIDTLYLTYPLRAINVKHKWPGTCSDEVKELAKTKPFEWVEICHAIEPNLKRNPNKIDKLNMPFSSHFWEREKQEKFLSKGGFLERPFAVGRWKTNDVEAYGTGPGHTALGLIKMLQSMQKTSVRAIHKQADPPVRIPSTLKDTVNVLPGGANYMAASDPREAIGKLYDLDFDVKSVEFKIEHIQQKIHEIFKRDLFLLITDRPEMTATEVQERSQEKLIMLGPVTERQIPDVLEPVLTFVFNRMARIGMLPPPPPEMQGGFIKINYVSLLAQAQKMIGLQGLRSYVDMATAVETLKASSPDGAIKSDADFILDEYAQGLALAPQVTRPQEEVNQFKQMQQQMQQLAQQVEMLKQTSEAGKNIAGMNGRSGT